MKPFKTMGGLLALLGAAEAGGTAYFYRRTMIRGNADRDRTMKMSGTDWSQYFPMIEERKAYMLAQPHEDVYIQSGDGLKLHATWFPNAGNCSDAVQDSAADICSDTTKDSADAGNTDKAQNSADAGRSSAPHAVICFHGYTSQGMSDYIGLSDYYLKRGWSMLLVDERAHGDSEGKYIGFGCLDRYDALKWIDWAIDQLGEDAQILLHGTSMGGATVLMASGLGFPPQIKGIVSDCAFTSAKEVFTHVLHSMYHLPAFPMIPISSAFNKKKAGYGLGDCNAAVEVRKAEVPILFIHGSNDTFVPCRMCDELYKNCASPKEKLIIEGAAHAESYYKNPEAYEQALDDFMKNKATIL
ncbi:MAG: alpha/beta hydrolase [Lachnospiraceae bacterium]|nr:alpha/beta hydrolase [Lachnospiraceae bacterium]